MADAFCGPSNALQHLKQHTQVDRSLQQDRLTGPRTSIQGFRTQDPRAGSLDAEFHKFENAPANPFQEPFIGNSFAVPPHFQQTAPSNWASDFQQLSISDQPLPAQQFRNYAPMVKSSTGDWHNEFMRHQQAGPTSIVQGKQRALDQPGIQNYDPQVNVQPGFTPMTSYGAPMNVQQYPDTMAHQSTTQIPDADWSQAFEEAFQDAFQEAEQSTKCEIVQRDSSLLDEENKSIVDLSIDSQPTEQIRIGSDAIDYTEMKDRTADHEQHDANALARVAGELLHNVQNDSSEKFQNSQFLDLMRKIRDRQVEVKNNDFETTTGVTSQVDAMPPQTFAPITDQAIRTTSDPIQDRDHFSFPDMDLVNAPREADFVDYSFDSDQFPMETLRKASHLHPGGKLYPEQSPAGTFAQMSGAVPAAESVSNGARSSRLDWSADLEEVYDGGRDYAGRYRRPAA